MPFINIHLKKSAVEDQVLTLNRVDFERAGTGRKAGYKFTIQFRKGRVSNLISSSPLATNLSAVLLQDGVIKDLLQKSDYDVSLNTRFQLHIKNLSEQVVLQEVEHADSTSSADDTPNQ